LASVDELRDKVATACRVLGRRGLVDGVLGHVSARVDDERLLVRCRGPEERGVARTQAHAIRLVDFDGNHAEPGSEPWQVPKELPIHTRLLQRRPDINAVVHAHPKSVLLCGLAAIDLRPVFGAYNIPAMRLAAAGVPVYPRPVLISRSELADQMLDVMGDRRVCLLRGHGITVAGASVEQAVSTAVDFDDLCSVSVALAQLGARPPTVSDDDLAELPDLGDAFNDVLHWRSLVAELGEDGER
jgi:ribulose-5-phosphate 4-epimerase/fuculose-1-phosphate aldolase